MSLQKRQLIHTGDQGSFLEGVMMRLSTESLANDSQVQRMASEVSRGFWRMKGGGQDGAIPELG